MQRPLGNFKSIALANEFPAIQSDSAGNMEFLRINNRMLTFADRDFPDTPRIPGQWGREFARTKIIEIVNKLAREYGREVVWRIEMFANSYDFIVTMVGVKESLRINAVDFLLQFLGDAEKETPKVVDIFKAHFRNQPEV